jgi:hypothetical protein
MCKQCDWCGSTFTPDKANASRQRFCCMVCANKWSQQTSASRRAECKCAVCGQAYRPKAIDRTTCCSRECGFEFQRRARKATGEARRVAERLRSLFANLKACVVCSRAFLSKHPLQTACGHECRKAQTARACATCDNPRAKVGKYLSRYCEGCRSEAKKVSRKQQRWNRDRKQVGATAKYQSKELLLLLRGLVRRAKGQCRLCGLAMSKQCDPSSDRALEFDHKIPLCKGGPDTVKNLQAICRRCNGLKGTFTAPEVVIGGWVSEHTAPICTIST